MLRSRKEIARQLFNAVLGGLLRRLDAARRDEAWAAARGLRRGPARTAAFKALRARYGLSEYAAHGHRSLDRGCWVRGHLDANTAQKIATEAWRAVEAYMFGKRGRPRFRRRGELRSVEGKKAKVGIRLVGWETPEPQVVWDGAHARLLMALLVDERDPLHQAALVAPVRYLRLVRREIRGRERFFCQLVCAGYPPVKWEAKRGEERFAIDVGPSWVAVSGPDGSAARHKLAPGAEQKAKAKRRWQRRLDRQRRANNPDCYDERGRAIRGKRPRARSNRMRRAEAQLREAERKLAATRRNEHGRLANRLLAKHGTAVHAERISYRAFQRCYGRSVRDRAPGRFMAELERKTAAQGGGLVEIPTRTTFLSQRCICGQRRKKQLRERRHRCGCEHVPAGTYADRDEVAAFLACFCDADGNFDDDAALRAWEGGAKDRLLRAEQVREPAAKLRAARPGERTRKGQSGSAGKRQRTPVRPPRAKRVDGQPRGQGRTPAGAEPGRNPPASAVGIISEWCEQVLVEVVLAARNSEWDEDQLAALLSPTSLSAALLPRQLLHAILQKRLAQKLGPAIR